MKWGLGFLAEGYDLNLMPVILSFLLSTSEIKSCNSIEFRVGGLGLIPKSDQRLGKVIRGQRIFQLLQAAKRGPSPSGNIHQTILPRQPDVSSDK